eukprot:ctg_126.g61
MGHSSHRSGRRYRWVGWWLILLAILLSHPAHAQLRGASPEVEKRLLAHAAEGYFQCSQQRLPIDALNDDYCDCVDGTDEPGTAACSGVSPHTLRFYCSNRGYLPELLHASRVNDGFCDCCDGSDEWQRPGVCNDTCPERGDALRAELEDKVGRWEAGRQQRRLLEQKAAARRQRRGPQMVREHRAQLHIAQRAERRLSRWKRRLEAYTKLLESSLERAELTPATHATAGMGAETDPLSETPASEDEHPTEDVPSSSPVPDELLDENMQNELQAVPQPSHADGPTATERSWRKRHAHGREGVASAKDTASSSPTPPQQLESEACRAVTLSWPAYVIVCAWQRVLQLRRRDLLANYRILRPLLGRVRDATALRRDASACVSLAASEYHAAVRQREHRHRELEEAQRQQTARYGPSDAFYAFHDEPCFQKQVGEHEFEVCLPRKVTQRSSQGGGNALLGHFERVQEPDAPGKPLRMLFENGDRCWHGPTRHCVIEFTCSNVTDILHVEEPEKCFYRIRMSCPAACNEQAIRDARETLEVLRRSRESARADAAAWDIK